MKIYKMYTRLRIILSSTISGLLQKTECYDPNNYTLTATTLLSCYNGNRFEQIIVIKVHYNSNHITL
jgi:hypothetical protein